MTYTDEMIPLRYGDPKMPDYLLTELYLRASKHSQYQTIAPVLKDMVDESAISETSRYEAERMDYIMSYVDIVGKKCLDIGGNTGYFSFRSLEEGGTSVDYYEGNDSHAAFVKRAAELLGWTDRLKIIPTYYDFNIGKDKGYDVCFLLNVLHHAGVDYGDVIADVKEAGATIRKQISGMSKESEYLVLQLGFNWGGDITKPLFEKGTKREMIDFVQDACRTVWDIIGIGIAEKCDEKVEYVDLNEENVRRNDSLGEFLNRPLFILRRA